MTGASFFQPARTITAGEIAELTGAKLSGPADAVVRGVASLDRAGEGDLVFADGKGKAPLLRGLRAAAILASAELAVEIPSGIAVLVSRAPQRDFAAVARTLYPEADRPASLCASTGISPAAHIHSTAVVEDGAVIDPGAVVGPFAQIGRDTVIAPNAVVGPRCTIGRGCFIGPNSTVQNAILGNAVVIHAGVHLGQDGFGYVLGRGGPEKMPQLGRVVIQDRVEIGAGSTVDRGALGDTVIGENTKIDNLVQIAHNCRIGRNCVIASHSGISGSVTIGDNAMLGGRVGIADHMTVGDNVQLGAASGVMSDVPSGARWGGFPAQPLREWLRGVAVVKRLSQDGRRRKDV